jgi:hypothetical protein
MCIQCAWSQSGKNREVRGTVVKMWFLIFKVHIVFGGHKLEDSALLETVNCRDFVFVQQVLGEAELIRSWRS